MFKNIQRGPNLVDNVCYASFSLSHTRFSFTSSSNQALHSAKFDLYNRFVKTTISLSLFFFLLRRFLLSRSTFFLFSIRRLSIETTLFFLHVFRLFFGQFSRNNDETEGIYLTSKLEVLLHAGMFFLFLKSFFSSSSFLC